jgi:hypothetical protein
MNALRLLMHQHDRIEALVVDLVQAGSGEPRERALEAMARELERHFDLEEEHFYSVVGPRLILVSADRFIHEHARIRALIAELRAGPPNPGFAGRLETLHGALVQHVGDEEIELFPEVKRRFGVDELDAIGDALERSLEGEPSAPAGELSPET